MLFFSLKSKCLFFNSLIQICFCRYSIILIIKYSFDLLNFNLVPNVQACHFANNLAVELMPTISVFDGLNDEGIGIFEILNYPLKTMMFACEKKNDFGFFIEVVSEICSCLLHQDVGFNLLISDSGRKVFLFFQVKKYIIDSF